MNRERLVLLNPGPITLTTGVRAALTNPDLCHRQPEYVELQNDVRARLTAVHDTADSHTAVLVGGSGTAAVEAMLHTLVPPDGHPVVLANGVYGERMAGMLERQEKPFTLLDRAWTDGVDLDGLDSVLTDASPSHVITVHHETTTGRLNDLPAIGARCRARGVPILLDAVSSFGGEAIEFDAWNVDACAGTANKCLHGAPGVSFALVRADRLPTGDPSFSRSTYLDLATHARAQDQGYPAFTPPIHVLYAFRQALLELDSDGGWRARHETYRSRSERVRRGLRHAGAHTLLDAGEYSATLTSFRLPDGIDFDSVYDRARSRGFVLYAGQKTLFDSIYRIAVMGEITDDELDRLVEVLAPMYRA